MIINRIKSSLMNRLYPQIIPSKPDKISNIFDYNNIIGLRPYWEDTMFTNNYYGVSYCLKRYSGYEETIQCAIEHGMPHTFDNIPEYKENDAKILLVSSEERKKQLQQYTNKTIIPYGPLIAYSEKILDDFALENTKENLGRTLVAFPMHSIEDYHFSNKTNEFINLIEKIKQNYNYDTVLICVYFVDIQRGLHIPYLQKGWQIVSNGNRLNYDFMDIQRTIMEIADFVLCQGYSSALGYAGFLRKPIILHEIDMIVNHNNEKVKENHWMQYGEKIHRLFKEYSDSLSNEQYQYLNWLYGYDCVKTPEEMKEIFLTSEKKDNE